MIALIAMCALSLQTFQVPTGRLDGLPKIEKLDDGVIQITYNLVSDPPGGTFIVSLEVSFDTGRSFQPAQKTTGDIGAGVRPGRGLKILWQSGEAGRIVDLEQFRVRVQFQEGTSKLIDAPSNQNDQAPGVQPTTSKQPLALPSKPTRQWNLGTTIFMSAEKRQTTTLFGSRQAIGSIASLHVALKDRIEIGGETNLAMFKDALDSAQSSPNGEERYLKDNFISGTVGYVHPIGKRTQLVPMAGAGIARLQTRSFLYTAVGSSVQTGQRDFVESLPVAASGAELRVNIAGPLMFVGSYRLYILLGDPAPDAPRSTIQHRPGAGLQWRFGAGQ